MTTVVQPAWNTGGGDAYETNFSAKIIGLDTSGVTLDFTRFVHQTAERESDIGTLAGAPISTVQRTVAGTVAHDTTDSSALEHFRIGQLVEGAVDWSRRYELMRLHSAVHLCLLGFDSIIGSDQVARRYVGHQAAVIEVRAQRTCPDEERIAGMIQEWVGEAIADDLPIVTTLRGHRCWHIDGVGTVACRGLHPRSTGEVGDVRIKAQELLSGLTRLTVSMG